MTAFAICKGLQWIIDAGELVEGVLEYSEASPQDTPEKVIELGVRVAQAAFSGFEAGAIIGKSSNTTMADLKMGELAMRLFSVPLKLTSAMMLYEKGNISGIETLEKGLMAPIAGCFRTSAEFTIYKESAYLDMSPEERSEHYRLALKPGTDPDCPEYIKHPIITSECVQYIETAKQKLLPTSGIEAALRVGTIEKVSKGINGLYQRLADRLRRQHGPVAPVINDGVPVAEPAAAIVPEIDDPFDIHNWREIPAELHGDPVFSKYMCSIMHTPIRFAVGDPNGGHLYDRANIVRWINAHHNSPMTRLALEVRRLVPKPFVQALINKQLQYHSDRLRAIAASPLEIPLDRTLQASVDNENPRYISKGDEV